MTYPLYPDLKANEKMKYGITKMTITNAKKAK